MAITPAAKEREKQAKLKALRKELDQEIQEQLEEKNALEELTGAQKFQIHISTSVFSVSFRY